MTERVERILSKPYSRLIIPDESGLYAAELVEFPGCFADGESPEDAYENLEEAARAWIESALAQGYPIPEPQAEEPSGTLSLRLPKSLHRRAIFYAQRDAVSLNTFIVSALSAAVGSEQLGARVSERVFGALARIENATTFGKVLISGAPSPLDLFDIYGQQPMRNLEISEMTIGQTAMTGAYGSDKREAGVIYG